MSKYRELLLMRNENEKALLEQGSVLIPKAPTKAHSDTVNGDYQPCKDVAIDCLQYLGQTPRNAFLRACLADRYGEGIKLSISGREGRAECFLTTTQQVDDLIFKLAHLRKSLARGSV